MTEELMQIDRSALEQLARLRQEEGVLRDRVAKAEAAKEKVTPVVYERVIGDYRTKLQAIERQAQPLKDAARREYGKLKNLEAEYGQALHDVTVDKEELEFRNQLGEFDESEFATKVAELEQRVAEQRSRVDAAAELKNQFVAAFASEDELEAVPAQPAPQPAAQPAAPAPEPAPAPPPVSRSRRPAAAPPQDTVPDTIPTPEPEPEPAPTPAAAPPRVAARASEDVGSATIATRVSTPLAPEVKARVTRTTDSGATTVFSLPRLVAIIDGQPADEYVLKSKTSIGRTSKNDIQVLDDSVSRAHCEVVVGKDGYHLVDLGSHNGVAVNGEKVRDRVLADGDIVDVGTRRFIFRFT